MKNSDKAGKKKDKKGYGENNYEVEFIESSRKVEDLTVHEVGLLLDQLNLSQYRRIFEQEQVDGKMLKDLNKEMLQSCFKMNAFHAKKLEKAIVDNWRPKFHQ